MSDLEFFLNVAVTGTVLGVGLAERPEQVAQALGEESEPKTLITHATSQAARFLGYEIRTQHADTKITRQRRAVNAATGLLVPHEVIRNKCAAYMNRDIPRT